MSKRVPPDPASAARCCHPLDRLLAPELFKALCDPTRAHIVACLAKCARPCSVGEIARCCSVDLSVVSRHLLALARSGVLEASKSGRTVLYRVRYAELARLLHGLADALEQCCSTERKGRHETC